MLHGTLSLDADLEKPAMAVPLLRPFTADDAAEGRTEPHVWNVAPSPDGQRLAFWVTDPDGFVVPGGTPPWGDTYNGESLVVMDVDGRNRHVVYDNRQDAGDLRTEHLDSWDGSRITWLDDETLLLPGWASRTFPAEGRIGVGRSVDVATGALGVALKYDDGGQQVRNIDQTAAGGGTKVGHDMGTLVRIVHRSGAVAPIDPADDTDNSYIRDVDVSADGDHIAFLERTPVGDGTVVSRLAVLDHAGGGEWTERTIVDNVGDAWVRWLPYESVDSSHLLVGETEAPYRVQSVATGSTVPEEERVRTVTEESDLTYRAWEVQPLPAAGSGSADVEIEAGSLAAQVGEPFGATVTVTNNGPDPATGVRLEVGTDQGAALTSLSAQGATCTAASGTCDIASLGVGQSVTVELTAPAMAAGVARLRASVLGVETDWDTGNSTLDEQIPVRVPPGQGTEGGRLIEQLGGCGSDWDVPCTMRIVTVNADGTDRQVIVDGGDDETLGLVEVHRRTGLVVWRSEDRRTGAISMNVSKLDGSLVRSVPAPPGMVTGVTTPDGRTLVFFHTTGGSDPTLTLRTLRMDVAGAQSKVIVPGNMNRIPNHFRVSPDGTRVAYLVAAQGQHGASPFVVDLDGRHDRAIPAPPSPTGSTIFWTNNLVWSPDGERVALRVSYEGPYDAHHIVLVPVDGGATTDLGEGPTEPGDTFFTLLDWSPDGSEILTSTNVRVIGVKVSDSEQVVYPFSWYPLWTGQPATDQPDPVEDTAPPTGSYSTSAASYLRPGQALTLSRTALADDVDDRADLDVAVSWGDGTVTEGDGTATSFAHSFDSEGVRRVTVTVTDRAGNEATLFDRTFTVDGTAPVVTIGEPSCGKRKPKACATYRSTAEAWSSVRGSVSDGSGVGIKEVVVTAVQKRSRGWWALTSDGWTKVGKRAAAVKAAAQLPAKVTDGKWKRALSTPSGGTLLVTARGTDKADNSHTVELTRTLTR